MRMFICAALLLVCCCTTSAQEWTRFRGPNGSGISDAIGIPVNFSETDYNWRIELPGSGHSSPAIWGDRLFITCGDSSTARRTILCTDAATGATKWKREYSSHTYRMNQDNSYASSSPAVDERRVYFCWMTPQSSQLIALDHDGNNAWSIELGGFVSQHGSGASPIVFEDLVILPFDQEGRDSYILAVDRNTGQIKWKLPRTSNSAAASTPCIFQAPGEDPQLIVTSRNNGLTGIDPRSGRKIWQLADVLDRRVVASPIVAGDLVIGNCGEGGVGRALVAVRPGSTTRPAKIEYQISGSPPPPYVPTPLYRDGLLYLWGDSGSVCCMRAATREVMWRLNLNAPFYGSPVSVDGRLYAISRKGELFVISADKPQLLARVALGEGSFATPAVADGRMYLRTFTHLICVGRK